VYSYCNNNEIDFTKLNGITGLVAPNFTGKSALIDVITYILFDRALRTSGNKKTDIMNVHKKSFYIEIEFLVNDTQYKIVKTGQKKGKTISRDIHIFEKIDGIYQEEKQWTMLNSQSRILEILGLTFNDFVFSCFMPQYNPNEILNRDNAERKDVISKFIKIDYFDTINSNVKVDLKVINKQIKELEEEVDILYKQVLSYEAGNNDYSCFVKESNKLKRLVKRKNNRIKELFKKIRDTNIDDSEQIDDDINNVIKQIKEKNNEENYLNKLIIDDNKKIFNIKTDQNDIYRIVNKIQYNTISDLKESKLYDKHKSAIDDIIKETLKENIDMSVDDIITEIIKKHVDKIRDISIKVNKLNENKNDIIKERLKLESELTLFKFRKVEIIDQLRMKNKNIKVEDSIKNIEDEIEVYESNIFEYDIKIQTYKEYEVEYNINKKRWKEYKKKLEKLKNRKELLTIYADATSFNGIPYMIFKIICSSLENNINNILDRFSEIKIKIKLSNTTKRSQIDIYKIDGEKEYNATGCSGYEQLVINMAFKIAMVSFSMISIPNILVIDETLSCVDKWNLDKIDQLFDYLKENYDFVLVITHIESIQNKFDNSLQIERTSKGSRLVC